MSNPKTFSIAIAPNGDVRMIYDDEHAEFMQGLGDVTISRASHVEPAQGGGWIADMSPVGGPSLGPFPLRSVALQAETDYLNEHLFKGVSWISTVTLQTQATSQKEPSF